MCAGSSGEDLSCLWVQGKTQGPCPPTSWDHQPGTTVSGSRSPRTGTGERVPGSRLGHWGARATTQPSFSPLYKVLEFCFYFVCLFVFNISILIQFKTSPWERKYCHRPHFPSGTEAVRRDSGQMPGGGAPADSTMGGMAGKAPLASLKSTLCHLAQTPRQQKVP